MIRKITDIIRYYASQIWDFFFYSRSRSLRRLQSRIPLEHKHLKHVMTWEYADDKPQTVEGSVVNNKWGDWKVRKGEYLQTISSKGWRFLTPWKNYGVLGYPSVVSKGHVSNPHFTVDYSVFFINNRKRYNLAFDFWFLSSKQWNWKDVYAEVMIWEDYNISRPAGKKVGEFTTSEGVEYKIHSAWIDKTKEDLGVKGWYLYTFVRKKPLRKNKKQGSINFSEFFEQLPNHVQSKYLHNIEFGSEVYNSDGILVVEKFNLEKNPA